MLTQEIIAGAFVELFILFSIIGLTPVVLCVVFFTIDNYKWNKRFNAEMERLRLEGLNHLHIPIVK